MLRVDPSLFANVVTSVQRTGNLTGGSVRGLPNGVVIEGLKGVNSFSSDIAEAQKEFRLGRVRSALERVKQMETQFNGIAGRWNASVGSVISSARQGRQQLSIQKLNEVKSAQTKMQQLTGPASKAFLDLVSALEHAVAMEGRETEDFKADADDRTDSDTVEVSNDPDGADSSVERADDTPDHNLLSSFAENYDYGARLEIRKEAGKKARIVPRLEKDQFYFFAGLDPPRVVRVRELKRQSVIVFDTRVSCELLIEADELKELIGEGIWILAAKNAT